jgi:hypothetical protein
MRTIAVFVALAGAAGASETSTEAPPAPPPVVVQDHGTQGPSFQELERRSLANDYRRQSNWQETSVVYMIVGSTIAAVGGAMMIDTIKNPDSDRCLGGNSNSFFGKCFGATLGGTFGLLSGVAMTAVAIPMNILRSRDKARVHARLELRANGLAF